MFFCCHQWLAMNNRTSELYVVRFCTMLDKKSKKVCRPVHKALLCLIGKQSVEWKRKQFNRTIDLMSIKYCAYIAHKKCKVIKGHKNCPSKKRKRIKWIVTWNLTLLFLPTFGISFPEKHCIWLHDFTLWTDVKQLSNAQNSHVKSQFH